MTLVWFRMPAVMHYGRFWAEEGTIYFVRAWTLPWWQALWSPYIGYLSLVANLAGLAARYSVPLRDAPCGTTAIAFALQTLPAVLLVTARDEWLRKPASFFAAVFIVAMPPVCDEVWLNTVNSQFHLALAAGLCLALDTPSGRRAAAQNVLLFLTPLASPASMSLTPLFIARAFIDRAPRRIVQAACVTSATIIQLAVFYTPVPARGHLPGPATIASIFAVKHLAIPFLGEQEAGVIAETLHGDIVAGRYPIMAMLAVGTISVLLLAAAVWRRRPEPVWLLLGGLCMAYLSYCAALTGPVSLITIVGSQRYAFAPGLLFALAVLAIAATASDWLSKVAWVIVIWLLVISLQQTVLPQDGQFAEGPSWVGEVSQWRADPSHRIAIWPGGWSISLPPSSRGS